MDRMLIHYTRSTVGISFTTVLAKKEKGSIAQKSPSVKRSKFRTHGTKKLYDFMNNQDNHFIWDIGKCRL